MFNMPVKAEGDGVYADGIKTLGHLRGLWSGEMPQDCDDIIPNMLFLRSKGN